MFTPPRHFAIPACPPHPSSSSSSSSSTLRPTILYRGAIPDTRNIPFLRRLKLKTILVLSPKVPKETEVVHDDRPVPAPSGGTGKKAGNGDGAMEGGGDNMVQKQRTRLTPIGRLKRREGVDVRWVKVDKMGEEKLGMSKGDVGEVLKTILDTSLYPLYIADLDGKSHTSLIIACLRKLQGWHMESIIRELERFEPEYEEYPFQSFITSFLTGSSSEPLSLPPPPYPPWLWPSLPNPNSPAPPAASTSVKAASTSTTPTSTTPHSGLNGMGPLRTAREPSAPSAAGSEIAPATAFGATVSAPASAAPSRAGTMKDRDGQMRMSARGNEPNTGGSGSSTGGSGVHTRETSGASVALSLASDNTNTSGSRGFGNSALSDMNQPARAGPTASSSSASIPSNAPAAAPQVPAPTKTRDRERDRERTTSANTALNSNSSQGESILPFPHPQHARRHPTMKLIFPAVALPAAPPASGSGQLSGGSVSGSGNEPGTGPGSRGVGAMSPLSRTNSRWDERREKERDRVRDKDKDKAKAGEAGKVREKNQARDSASMSTATSVRPSPATSTASHSPTTAPVSTHGASTGHSPVQSHGLLAAATSIVTSGLDNLTRVISPSSREADPSESSGLSGSVAEDSSGRSIGQSGIDEQKSSVPPPRQDRTIDAVDPDATPRLPRSVSFRRQSSFSAPSSPGRNRSSALPRETAESSTMTGSPGSRISQSAQPQPHYGDGSRNADTVDLSRSPPERSSPSGSIDVPSPGSDDEKAGQGGRNELNGDARPTREPSVEYDEDLDDYSDEYDEDEEEEEEDEDEEDDEEVAPTALHISALDLAGYG